MMICRANMDDSVKIICYRTINFELMLCCRLKTSLCEFVILGAELNLQIMIILLVPQWAFCKRPSNKLMNINTKLLHYIWTDCWTVPFLCFNIFRCLTCWGFSSIKPFSGFEIHELTICILIFVTWFMFLVLIYYTNRIPKEILQQQSGNIAECYLNLTHPNVYHTLRI